MPKLDRILHVEDEPDIREITQLVLEIVGEYTLMQCASGNEALEVAQEFDPDMLLLDVMMPGMSGTETLENLRKIPSISKKPVIFMTASLQPEKTEELLKYEFSNVIAKPFEPENLVGEIGAKWAEF